MDSLRFAFGLCAAVLQCAPRARTKGRGMLRIRQSASKDGAVGERAGKGLRESLNLSPPEAKRPLVKGTREAPPFHKPLGVKGSIEKLAFHKPMSCRRQGKVSGYRSPFARLACACASLEALCQVLCQCSSSGARTGRALQNGLHTERLQNICSAIGEGPSGALAREIASPCPKALTPRRLQPMDSLRFAFGLCARSFAVRAPCAHQRQGNASHKA